MNSSSAETQSHRRWRFKPPFSWRTQTGKALLISRCWVQSESTSHIPVRTSIFKRNFVQKDCAFGFAHFSIKDCWINNLPLFLRNVNVQCDAGDESFRSMNVAVSHGTIRRVHFRLHGHRSRSHLKGNTNK